MNRWDGFSTEEIEEIYGCIGDAIDNGYGTDSLDALYSNVHQELISRRNNK